MQKPETHNDAATPVIPFTEHVLPFLRDWRCEGLRAALVTLVGVDGSSPRPPGSQMAVAADGRAAGIITGGCAQAAIVAEAKAAIGEGRGRLVRLGEGSPYMDIKLPCGSGLDVHIDLTLSDTDLARLLSAQEARRPAELVLGLDGAPAQVRETENRDGASVREGTLFRRRYAPRRRLVAAGKGPVVAALARMGAEAGFEVIALSPEEETRALSAGAGIETRALGLPEDFPVDLLDPWTALAVLFHDHDWEPPILARALATNCFYVGALGSRRTHAQRLETLRAMGLAQETLARIRGPIGLGIGAKSPPDIAVAILAEIVGRHAGPAA